jgi:aspartyl-tRNA(Asn)/glutamyl-tRNA(Gln) amidotransferase subunit A
MKSIAETQSEIKSGKVSVESTLQSCLHNIHSNKNLNSFIEVFQEESLARAKELDAKIKSGAEVGKLFGAIIALKDNICYKGHQVTASSKILSGFESMYSSTVVEKLLAEDAIIIGRCNCDEFAMGSSNETSFYGPVLNPIDNSKVPGGSSGGSAVSVKADMCHIALGSDTGGSIRQPASFCDVVGFKPSYGRVSRNGLIAYGSSFDQIGPFASNIEDTRLIYEIIGGLDPKDATSSSKPIQSSSIKKEKYTIAYFPEIFESEGVSDIVKEKSKEFLAKMTTEGHEVISYSFKYLDYLIPIYYVLTTAEASSNLARFDGVKYGHRAENVTDLEDLYVRSRTEGFGAEVKRRIMLGTFVLSAGFYDAYYTKAQKVRRILRNDMQALLSECDFLYTPTCPSVPFGIGDKTASPLEMYFADIFTVLANITGMPAISLPIYKDESGLPIGVQLMSNVWEDQKLLDFSELIMK